MNKRTAAMLALLFYASVLPWPAGAVPPKAKFSDVVQEGGETRAYSSLGVDNTSRSYAIANTISITDNTTIPSNVSIEVKKGGSFSVASGKTLTINGSFSAGMYRVFTGAGTVVFGLGAVSEAFPQWWGGDATATVDSAAAINAAGRSLAPEVNMAGLWLISSPIYIDDQYATFNGHNRVGSIIYPSKVDISVGGGSNALFIFRTNTWNGSIKSLRFHSGASSFGGWAISAIEGVTGGEQAMISGNIEDIWMSLSTLAYGFFTGGALNSWFHGIQFDPCYYRFNFNGPYADTISIFNIDDFGTYGYFLKTDAAAQGGRINVSDVRAYAHQTQNYFDLDNVVGFNATNIQYSAGSAGGAVPKFANIKNSRDVNISAFTAKASAGEFGGIYIDSSAVKISHGTIDNVTQAYNAIDVRGTNNDISIDDLTVPVGGSFQVNIVDNTGGKMSIANSTFDKAYGYTLKGSGAGTTLDVDLINNRLLNGSYATAPGTGVPMLRLTTSGVTRFIGNKVGVTDNTAIPTFLYYLDGSGSLVMGGNTILGLGTSGEFHPSSSQAVSYIAPNPGGTSFRSGAGSPIGSVTPLFSGENYWDTGGHWYRSNGVGANDNTVWTPLN